MPTSDLNNSRIYNACQGVLYRPRQSSTTGGTDNAAGTMNILRGVQSIGVDSSLPRTPYTDFGRFQQKYGSYGKQEFSITIDRVLDGGNSDIGYGRPFYYPNGSPNSYQASHLLGSSNLGADGFSGTLRNYDICIVYSDDEAAYLGDSKGNQEFSSTTYRSCLLTSVDYTFAVDGPIRESLSFTTGVVTHNDISGLGTVIWGTPTASPPTPVGFQPPAMLLTRQHLDSTSWQLPDEVQSMFDMGKAKAERAFGPVLPVLGLQSIELGMTIDYMDLFDNGEFGGARGDRTKQNYMKQVVLPVGVTASFTGVVADTYGGNLSSNWELQDTNFSGMYEADRSIALYTKVVGEDSVTRYISWLLGTKNYLTGISFGGGDASGGGNVEATLSYQNDYSDFVVFQDTTLYANPTSSDTY